MSPTTSHVSGRYLVSLFFADGTSTQRRTDAASASSLRTLVKRAESLGRSVTSAQITRLDGESVIAYIGKAVDNK